jgi:hypothetical protein
VPESGECREQSSVERRDSIFSAHWSRCSSLKQGHRRPYGLRRPSLGELRSNPGVSGTKHSPAGAELGFETPPIGVPSFAH